MSKAVRTSVSIDSRLMEAAKPRLAAYFASSFSEYISELIKRDILTAQAADDKARGVLLQEPVGQYTPRTPAPPTPKQPSRKREA